MFIAHCATGDSFIGFVGLNPKVVLTFTAEPPLNEPAIGVATYGSPVTPPPSGRLAFGISTR